jgi:hypothetical protein
VYGGGLFVVQRLLNPSKFLPNLNGNNKIYAYYIPRKSERDLVGLRVVPDILKT